MIAVEALPSTIPHQYLRTPTKATAWVASALCSRRKETGKRQLTRGCPKAEEAVVTILGMAAGILLEGNYNTKTKSISTAAITFDFPHFSGPPGRPTGDHRPRNKFGNDSFDSTNPQPMRGNNAAPSPRPNSNTTQKPNSSPSQGTLATLGDSTPLWDE